MTDLVNTEAEIQAMFGRTTGYNTLKYQQLWKKVIEKGWSKERFNLAYKTFSESVRYETWVIADFLKCDEVSPKFYGYSWFINQVKQQPEVNMIMDIAEIDGISVYRIHDGQIFKGIEYTQIKGKSVVGEKRRIAMERKRLATKLDDLEIEHNYAMEFLSKPCYLKRREIVKMNSFTKLVKIGFKKYYLHCKSVVDSYEVEKRKILTEMIKFN